MARSGLAIVCATLAIAVDARAEDLAKRDFADPFVLRDGESYYAFATNGNGANIQVARSADHQSWTALPDALPTLPAWAAKTRGLVWAPSVLRRGEQYVLYYTARDATSGFQCISRAVSAAAAGPYVDESARPFVCQVAGEERMCGSIDPSPFVDADGKPYLLWKSDENAVECRAAPRLWTQALSDDGKALVGAATPLLAMDRPWEAPIIEGPSMVVDDGHYYLFYSANWYDSDKYAVGYATCAGPRGPCAKATTDKPLFASDGEVLGPGGQELFRDATGAWWMAYHAWTAPKTTYAAGGARGLRVSRVTFEAGVPVIGAARLEALNSPAPPVRGVLPTP